MAAESAPRSDPKGSLRAINLARDQRAVIKLIREAFCAELSPSNQRILKKMEALARHRWLLWWIDRTGLGLDMSLAGFVWEVNGQIVANVSLGRVPEKPYRWTISNVAVAEPYRRQGIGRALMEQAIQTAQSNGARVIELRVREDNEPALHLYRSLGFVARGRTVELYRPAEPWPPGPHKPTALRRAKSSLSPLIPPSPLERLSLAIEGIFTGRHHTWWQFGDRPQAILHVDASRPWGRDEHRVSLSIAREAQGNIETLLATDTLAILRRYIPRHTEVICITDATETCIRAWSAVGFRHRRTLIHMELRITDTLPREESTRRLSDEYAAERTTPRPPAP